MSVASPGSTAAASQRRRDEPDSDRCAQCQAPLREDQEFCLHCGSSRSLIYSPPDWRFPVAVALVVVVIALVGFVFALTRLSSNAGKTAAAKAAAVSTTSVSPVAGGLPVAGGSSTSTSTRESTSAAVSGVSSWPVGQDGWTVVLEKDQNESDAYAKARQVAPSLAGVGVLNSSDHPSMTPGYWIVFSGRYPDQAGAETAATKLVSAGYAGARARRVAKPGGL